MNLSVKNEYRYTSALADHTQHYLWPRVLASIKSLRANVPTIKRVLDVGCGNGAFVAKLNELGFDATGIDPSESGISIAQRAWPNLDFRVASAYDDLHARFGRVDIATSLEVVEHLYSPREFAARIFDVVRPGGAAVISTPFHGYWKNLLLAITGKLNDHLAPLWDHGHIKFWSTKSLGQLLTEAGFVDVRFEYAGRFYPFSKSVIAICRKNGTA